MFVNSLFKDYIMENGMKDWKGESTRDIICLEFNFGTRSYEEEIAHIKKIAKNARIDRNGRKASIRRNKLRSRKIKSEKSRNFTVRLISTTIHIKNYLPIRFGIIFMKMVQMSNILPVKKMVRLSSEKPYIT